MATSSTPSTTTTVQSNPLGQAQVPYLTGLWDVASQATGYRDQPALGGQYLQQIQNLTGQNYNATGGLSTGVVPAAMSFTNQALAGTLPQNAYASGPQINSLSQFAPGAIGTGLGYGNQIAGAANAAPGTVAPWASNLGTVGNAGLSLLPYGTNAYGTLTSMAPGALSAANPAEAGLYANSGMAIGGNPVFSSGLTGAANGQYINPNTNPALAQTIKSATDPLVNQYQLATAPQTTSQFEAAGRYNPEGAMGAYQNNNQYNLGQGLASTVGGIVNNAYNTGLNAMLSAGNTLGSAYNTGIGNINSALGTAGQLAQSGYNTAGNLVGQGANALGNLFGAGTGAANTAYSQGGALDLNALQQQMAGLSSAAGAANAGYGTGLTGLNYAGSLANTGQLTLGGISQSAPDLANFPLSQASTAFNSMWAPMQNYAALLGQPIGGNTMTTQTTPYYQNTGQNIMNMALSGLTLARMI